MYIPYGYLNKRITTLFVLKNLPVRHVINCNSFCHRLLRPRRFKSIIPVNCKGFSICVPIRFSVIQEPVETDRIKPILDSEFPYGAA